MIRLRYPGILAYYFTLSILAMIARVTFALSVVIIVIDTIEVLRRTAHKADFSILAIPQLVLFKLPFLLIELSPLIVFLGCAIGYWSLARNQEVIIARASGLSLPQFIAPIMVGLACVGLVIMLIGQPVAANLYARQQRLLAHVLGTPSDTIRIASSNVWIREMEGDDRARIIHGKKLDVRAMRLDRVSVVWLDRRGVLERMASAARARLRDGVWRLEEVRIIADNGSVRNEERYDLPTAVVPATILSVYIPHETVPFWDLPAAIESFKVAGVNHRRQLASYQKLLFLPIMMAVMGLLAIPITGRSLRAAAGFAQLLFVTIISAFVLYIFGQFIISLAVSGEIAVIVAVLVQIALPALAGLALMAHSETT